MLNRFRVAVRYKTTLFLVETDVSIDLLKDLERSTEKKTGTYPGEVRVSPPETVARLWVEWLQINNPEIIIRMVEEDPIYIPIKDISGGTF